MILQQFRLDDAISRTTEDLTLWQSEKCKVKIGKDALAVAVKLDNQTKGYVVQGKGHMILDTIVETERGAIGKPTEKNLDKPFLMLTDTDIIQDKLARASAESLAEAGYTDSRDFIEKTERQFHKYLSRGRIGGCCWGHEQEGTVFAFVNEKDDMDFLVLKGSKIVYKSENMVFVSGSDNVGIKGPEHVILLKGDKSIVINR